MNRFRTIALTAVAGLVLVACGPAASGSQSAGASAGQPASAAAQASGADVGPSFTEGAVADLEALIPDTIGSFTMQKTSAKGDAYLLSPDSSPEMVQFLQDTGVSPTDVTIAIGSGYTADLSSSVFMFVIRANGADSGSLLTAFKNASNASGESPTEWASATVGGKQVEASPSAGGTSYLYARGDVLFWVIGTPAALAEEALRDLP